MTAATSEVRSPSQEVRPEEPFEEWARLDEEAVARTHREYSLGSKKR